ncbi:hypothetical protein BDZ89DRAFT_1161059 [Hymenopellis radicata]|nr:hypothetical protein BDZ89DRAFT_1161059 [Hymenopellis radicata]
MSSVAQELGLSEHEARRLIGNNLNGHIISILCYGLYVMIFVATMHQIVARHEWPRQRVGLTIVLCLIWAVATMSFGLSWNGIYTTYVTHGQSEDSVLGYISGIGSGNFTPQRRALNILGMTATPFNVVLAELTNVWRCGVLYQHNWFVVSLPVLCILGGLISHVFYMLVLFPPTTTFAGTLTQINWIIVYYSITASINILTTSLIIVRIIRIVGLKRTRTYRGLIEIMVESAFLFSATYLVYLSLYLRDFYLPYFSSANLYAQGMLNAVAAAAPTMIIGRVMTGEASPNDSWTRTSLPHMRTNMRSIAENIRFASVHPTRTENSVLDTDVSVRQDVSHPSTSPMDEELGTK